MFEPLAFDELQRYGAVWPSGRKLLVAVAFLTAIVVVFLTVAASGRLETVIVHERQLRHWINTHQLSAFLYGLAIYTTISLIPGTSGKAIVAGWLYGFWQGLLLVELSLTVAALVAFLVSRHLLRDVIESRYSGFVLRLNNLLRTHASAYLLSLRLAHVPFTFLNYALGPTPLATRTFVWTTALGLLPGTLVFVFTGHRLPTLAELAERGAWRLLDPWLIVALALSASAIPLVHLTLNAMAKWRQRPSMHRHH